MLYVGQGSAGNHSLLSALWLVGWNKGRWNLRLEMQRMVVKGSLVDGWDDVTTVEKG